MIGISRLTVTLFYTRLVGTVNARQKVHLNPFLHAADVYSGFLKFGNKPNSSFWDFRQEAYIDPISSVSYWLYFRWFSNTYSSLFLSLLLIMKIMVVLYRKIYLFLRVMLAEVFRSETIYK